MAIELNPQSSQPYGQLAEVLAELGEIEQAVSYYQEAVKLNPKHQATHPQLVAAL